MAISVVDCWGDRKREAVNLMKHWSKISLEHACAWQRDTFDWCTDKNDLTSMEWVKELLTNSCDVNLVKSIDKKFDCLVCVCRPPVTRGVTVKRAIPIASNPPQ
jgi:hypothetical protein